MKRKGPGGKGYFREKKKFGGGVMEFQEKYGRLLATIDREDLNSEDIAFIQWVCKWDDETFYKFKNLIVKIKAGR